MSGDFKIKVSGSAPMIYPVDTYYGLLWLNESEVMEIPKRYPYQGEWGAVLSNHLLIREDYPMPWKLDVLWLSIVEMKYYCYSGELQKSTLETLWNKYKSVHGEGLFSHIIVGMAPYGRLSLWFNSYLKSILVLWEIAKKEDVDFFDFKPDGFFKSLKEYCCSFINSDPRVRENLEKNGLPPRDLFDNYMKQFTYRYQVAFGQWDEEKREWRKDDEKKRVGDEEAGETPALPELDYIEEALYDGTHDKLHDGGLMKYHEAGKPKKLAVKWHVKKREWTAYFWLEDEEIRQVFDRFYGAHPDTKTDFMIRIDPEKDKYELALYRYGLREPQVIPERAYQLLVFRNKFECFRSENYSQERGAWIW